MTNKSRLVTGCVIISVFYAISVECLNLYLPMLIIIFVMTIFGNPLTAKFMEIVLSEKY